MGEEGKVADSSAQRLIAARERMHSGVIMIILGGSLFGLLTIGYFAFIGGLRLLAQSLMIVMMLLFLVGVAVYAQAKLVYSSHKRRVLGSNEEEERVIDSLITCIKSKKHGEFGSVVSILGDLGDKRATESLCSVLADEKIGKEAIKALGRIGDERAIKPLYPYLKDGDSGVRRETAVAMDRLDWKPENDLEKCYYLFAMGELDKLAVLGEPAVRLLIDALKYEDPNVKVKAAKVLVKIGDDRAYAAINEGLKGVHAEPVKKVLEEALRKIKRQQRRF